MRFIVLRTAALLMLGLAAAGNAADCPPEVFHETNVSREDLEKIPTARDPWEVWKNSPWVLADRIQVGGSLNSQPDGWFDEPMVALGSSPGYYDFDGFEELRSTLLEAEAKALCEEVRRNGWKALTLERLLRAAPSQEEALIKAHSVGLLRGFVALLLQGKGCAEPPAEVLAEAQEYSRRFGGPASDRLPKP